MRIEIRTENEITSVAFPSITDASLESAVFFIDNGWTESAKLVIGNMANEMREMAVYSICKIEEINEALDSEMENANYWRNLVESRTTQLDLMREANESLVKKVEKLEARDKQWEWIADDKSNTIRIINAENRSLRQSYNDLAFDFLRLEKAFAGISRGYGVLKRAFNAHVRKINRQIEEIGHLTESLNHEIAFNEQLMAQNDDFHAQAMRDTFFDV